MTEEKIHIIAIPFDMAGQRLDLVLASLFPDFSRSRLQQWLQDGHIEVDGDTGLKARYRVLGGEQLRVHEVLKVEQAWQAEAIPLDIRYEDEELLVINKPAGLVVHPAAGNPDGTMLNALIHHVPSLATLPRAGIVHRLDKDTTGLLVVAKSLRAHTALVEQLQQRAFLREYLAVVQGVMTAGGTVDAAIGRHPVNRQRMAVTASGKPAVTHYRVEERFRAHTLIRVRLETGRTHQIRVHMAHVHFPLLGDPVYGGRLKLPAACEEPLATILRDFRRQALHAARLGLSHPVSGEFIEWQVDVPADMQNLLDELRHDSQSHKESS